MKEKYIEISDALIELQQRKKERGVDVSIARLAEICLEMGMGEKMHHFVKQVFTFKKAKSYQVNNANRILQQRTEGLEPDTPYTYWGKVWFEEQVSAMELKYPELNSLNQDYKPKHDMPAFEILREVIQEIWDKVPEGEKHPPKQAVIRERISEKLKAKGVEPSDNLIRSIDLIARPPSFK